jgi:hypothetical protein
MSEAASTAARDAHGRFQPGMSGNPAGKKPGTRNWSSAFRQMLADGDVTAAGRFIIQKAHEGNFAACKFIIDHVDPKPRGRPIELDVAPAASLVDRYAALTRAMLGGAISPQEAHAMARLLEREAALQAAEPARRRAAARAAAPAAAPAPAATLDLHSACKSPIGDGEPVSRHARRRSLPDWRAGVGRQALMSRSPASGLHPEISRAPNARSEPRRAAA